MLTLTPVKAPQILHAETAVGSTFMLDKILMFPGLGAILQPSAQALLARGNKRAVESLPKKIISCHRQYDVTAVP